MNRRPRDGRRLRRRVDSSCEYDDSYSHTLLNIVGWSVFSPGESFKLRDSVGVEDWDRYIREMSQHGVTWGDEARDLAEICRDRDEM